MAEIQIINIDEYLSEVILVNGKLIGFIRKMGRRYGFNTSYTGEIPREWIGNFHKKEASEKCLEKAREDFNYLNGCFSKE